MFVKHFFELNQYTVDTLKDMEPRFGYDGFGEFIFYRTYSRNINGFQEEWVDVVIRVINGTMSIRKDWYLKNFIPWNEAYWQDMAKRMAISLFKMEWSPPGRGLWAMGTQFIYERGGMALYNCAGCSIFDDIADDIDWIMDSLMLGVGVGFSPERNDDLTFKNPKGSYEYVIPDTREGWTKSCRYLWEAYQYGTSKPKFIYDEIRKEGLLIKGFGGISSGPGPLKILHLQIEEAIEKYMTDKYYDSVLLKIDSVNQVGCCCVSGNVRRSAELAALSINDPVFKNLKNYNIYPERAEWGWMSNNSVTLENDEDFEQLGEIAQRIIANGEPGYLNLRNFPKGRIGKKDKAKKDVARVCNPCILGSTKICLADGRGFTAIQDILDKDVDVYCINDNDEICIRKMRNPRLTGEKVKVLKIVFDNGDTITVTPNHKFMLRDRSFIEAENLKAGDSLNVIRRYIPENCIGESYWDKYVSLNYAGKAIGEHKLIAQNKFHHIFNDEHIHHIDENRLNNNPDNLDLKESFEYLSDHSVAENNANWSGYTSEDLINFGINYAKRLGRRFSSKEWRQLGFIQSFSKYRKKELGSFEEFAYMCASLAEVVNNELDTRTLRFYLKMIKQGYEAEIIGDKVYVTKICEACNESFQVKAVKREHACCSLSCSTSLIDRSKAQESFRKTVAQRKETIREQQLEVYCQLRNELKRTPLKSEWAQRCTGEQVSNAICTKSAPFRFWHQLEYAAKEFNHRVAYVIEAGEEDVYNGTVDEYHNFIIGGWESYTPFGRKIQIGVISPQCGEIPLESAYDFDKVTRVREVCNIDETFPTNCNSPQEWYNACKYATIYCSTVSLLPTHQPSTNRVVARNRRIGVGIVDYTGWVHDMGVSRVIKYLRKGYNIVKKTNISVNGEAGVPEAIRVTTVKPGGTIPKLAGKTSGMMYPNFHTMIRRVRVARNHPIHDILSEANVPYEADLVSANTDVFEWPIKMGPAKQADEVSVWEQAMNLVLLQREWSDNAVSNTLNFRPKWKLIKVFDRNYYLNPIEEMDHWLKRNISSMERYQHLIYNIYAMTSVIDDGKIKITIKHDDDLNATEIKIYEYDPRHEEDCLEAVLAAIAPLTKSVSLLPHSAKGAYPQMPEEGISEAEYQERLSAMSPIDWSKLSNSDGVDQRYCDGEVCINV